MVHQQQQHTMQQQSPAPPPPQPPQPSQIVYRMQPQQQQQTAQQIQQQTQVYHMKTIMIMHTYLLGFQFKLIKIKLNRKFHSINISFLNCYNYNF